MTGVFRRGDRAHRTPCGPRGGACSDATTSQGTAGAPETGRGREGSSLEALDGAANTMTVDLLLPNLWEDGFRLSSDSSLWCFVTVALGS